MPLPIEQYGMIGDCHTAALVGDDGSIDWLCFPSFDSGACFAALLGGPQNGRWLLAPADQPKSVRRRYRGDTLILETDYETADGAASVIDCMTPRSGEPDLIRLVVGRRGTVRMRTELVIRFDYGSIVPWVRHTGRGIRAIGGPDSLLLETPVELRGHGLTTVGEFTVSAGEEVPFVLMWYPSHKSPPDTVNIRKAIEQTEKWWQEWAGCCSYEGPWREAVMRSLIVLKALTFGPTGGHVAAPTTSLPEKIGGVRNWDYRYCWIRDATFTMYSLLDTGYRDEARSWRDWLLRAVAGEPGEMHIMYGIFGQRRLPEMELDWLEGYEGSQPVRIGNNAWDQFQLDVYGELLDMLHVCRQYDIPESDADWRFELAVMRFLEEAWQRPDEGIWEVRGPSRHFTHSKVMAWVAFDRAVKAVEADGRDGPVEKWRKIRKEIHDEICTKGFNKEVGAFTQFYGSDLMDASLLMIPLVGFLPADDPRMKGTIEAIGRKLVHDGFVDRYEPSEEVDGLPPGEAAFLLCSFWYVDNLALLGRRDEAIEIFERLLSVRTDLGLLSEEYDTDDRRLLGNFPQGFSHMGMVNSACNLTLREGPARERPKE